MSEWRPILEGEAAASALELAREVGTRLAHRDDPTRARQTVVSGYGSWPPVGLAEDGHPGIALAFAQLDACFPGEGWRDAAHGEIGLAVEALRRERRAPGGLFVGLAGLAFAAHAVDSRRYASLLDTLDGLIARRAESLVERLESRGVGATDQEIDVVFGLAGMGAYLLTRGDGDRLQPIADALVRLLGADEALPPWHTPPEVLHEDSRRDFPRGFVNCGLSHGFPGPLALLALVRGTPYEPPGLVEALRRASASLADQSLRDEWGAQWPSFVSLDPAASPVLPTPAGWCYGAPGVARTLWLAGTALGDPELQAVAVDALEAVHRRPPEVLQIASPTFCHGLAGLLQITMRFVVDTGSPALRAAGENMAARLLELFEPDSARGYRNVAVDGSIDDQTGLMQGAAGVALVLLAAASDVPPRWDRAFLLA